MMWGVIDIGSNTVRLVTYSLRDGRLHPMLNKKYAAGLAGYVDAKGNISEDGVRRLLEILTEIRAMLRHVRVKNIYPFATAALRNSGNGREIVSRIREECGFDVRVLTGEEEAIFDYYGATSGPVGDSGLLVDVGGGSTELTFFCEGEIRAATSLPVGSLNLYRRFVGGLLPTAAEAKKIRKELKRRLESLAFSNGDLITQPIYSVGGTARASRKLINARFSLPSSNTEYTYDQLKETLRELEESPKVLADRILLTSPERIHTIVPGLLVFKTVAKFFSSQRFIVSEYGVREGYLLHVLKEEGVLDG